MAEVPVMGASAFGGTLHLICGDCLEKMKDIPDKSIDMILCD
jgi:predicted methyltransferase